METSQSTRPPLGRMLVTMGLVQEPELALALAEHEQTGRSLGEILIATGALSPASLADALLLQQTWRPLGQLLVERRLVTERELEEALAEQDESGRPLGEIVRTRFGISAAELGEVLAEQHEIELELERGFGSGLRRGIDVRRRRRRSDDEHPPREGISARVRKAPRPEDAERVATLQAALEAREETIAALGSMNRKRVLEAEALRRELVERDRVIDDLRRRLDELDGGSRPAGNVVPLNPR